VISRYPSVLRRKGLTLLVVVAVVFLPAAAEAGGLAFRNDTDSPILVQGVCIINRVARRGKLHVLRPGEVSRELVLVPGTILITVADAKQPRRILCQEAIPFTGADQLLAVQVEEPEKSKEGDKAAANEKDRKPVTPKFKLVLLIPTPPVSPPTLRR
jgi:hypothetical protein